MPEIPTSVEDVLDESATFEPGALAAVRGLARSKPWQGTDAERAEKFNACAAELARVYRFEPVTVAAGARSGFDAESRTITLKKLSVVTFLHLMARLRGADTFGAFRWSINIFRRCFPRSFSRCERVGPYLVVR